MGSSDPTSPRREASLFNLPGFRARQFFVLFPIVIELVGLLTLTGKSKESNYAHHLQGSGHDSGGNREKAGLLPNTEVEFELDGQAVRIVKSRAKNKEDRGARLIGRLRGAATIRMSTDEIMELTRSP
ncbi:MAG: hypothetical protein OEM59_02795 [Rhodospirillales bacterium]|nr:hypothetical protein [Rhodospirillales bacterium]